MLLDHIGFTVADFGKSRAFYVQALAPLGIEIRFEDGTWAMMGRQPDRFAVFQRLEVAGTNSVVAPIGPACFVGAVVGCCARHSPNA